MLLPRALVALAAWSALALAPTRAAPAAAVAVSAAGGAAAPPVYARPEDAPFVQGVGVGSRVVRGPQWHYGDQDGGAGGRGTVIELRRWKALPDEDSGDATTVGARVLWDEGGHVNTYRWSDARPAGAGGAASTGPGTGPRDLEVVGWRAVTPELLAAVPNYQEVLHESMRRQMSPPETLRLLRALFAALGGPGWRVRRGWDEGAADAGGAGGAGAAGAADPRAAAAQQRRAAEMAARGGNNPCTDGWEGVSCRDGVVVGLDLSSNNVSLTPGGGGAPRALPAELWQLAALGLHSLNLANNPGLAGATLDGAGLCGARALRFLDASSCGLRGALPACLGRLGASLETASLHSNDFEGAVPAAWAPLAAEAGGRLRLLQLHNNARLAGPVPRALLDSAGLKLTLPQQLRAQMLPGGAA